MQYTSGVPRNPANGWNPIVDIFRRGTLTARPDNRCDSKNQSDTQWN
jgi:hypothetical protein